MRVFTAIFTTAIVLAPTAASASDVTCVWRALPEDVRSHALNLTAVKGAKAAWDGLEEETLGQAMLKCFAIPASERKADAMAENIGGALFGHLTAAGAELNLKETLGIESAALERGYNSLSSSIRRGLVNAFMKDKDLRDSEISGISDAMLVTSQSWPEDKDKRAQASEQFITYVLGRALREQYEAKF